MRKESISVFGTSQLPDTFLLLLGAFFFSKYKITAYELCENFENAIKPETSTENYILYLSRIYVEL